MKRTVTKRFSFHMGHRLQHHNGKCRNPHGHTYHLEITLSGSMNIIPDSPEKGMVVDFGVIEKVFKEQIYSKVDHAFMVCNDDPFKDKLIQGYKDGLYEQIPLIVDMPPTAEYIAEWCYRLLVNFMPKYVNIDNIKVWETDTSSADYYEH